MLNSTEKVAPVGLQKQHRKAVERGPCVVYWAIGQTMHVGALAQHLGRRPKPLCEVADMHLLLWQAALEYDQVEAVMDTSILRGPPRLSIPVEVRLSLVTVRGIKGYPANLTPKSRLL